MNELRYTEQINSVMTEHSKLMEANTALFTTARWYCKKLFTHNTVHQLRTLSTQILNDKDLSDTDALELLMRIDTIMIGINVYNF